MGPGEAGQTPVAAAVVNGSRRLGPVRVIAKGPVVLQDAHRQAQRVVNGAHPYRVTAGQVVIDRDDVDALARQSVKIGGQGGNQRLAFAGFHLGNLPPVQHHSSDELHVVVPLPQAAPSRLPHHGERFGENVIQRLALLETDLELPGFGRQLVVVKPAHPVFQGVNLFDDGTGLGGSLFGTVADNFTKQ